MSIGYACITLGIQEKLKSCTLKKASKAYLESIIKHNLKVLERQIEYNIQNNIKLFRISSDIIPFGSHEVNSLKWWEIFQRDLEKLGEKIKEGNIRVSMHPGQYTILNSTKEEVVKNSIKDLEYHCRFLDSLKVDSSCKIVIHIGGSYGDKKKSLERFAYNYISLKENIKSRLVIENDEKVFNIEDVMYLGKTLNIPVVFDNLHHEINKPTKEYSHMYWINKAAETWRNSDGRPKIHYSQQKEDSKVGSHSDTINICKFINYYNEIAGKNLDIMLEVKDKDISALKCIHCTEKIHIALLEKQWAKYKYLVLEKSPKAYYHLRQILKEKNNPESILFYRTIENVTNLKENKTQAINALQHIWGYFKKNSLDKEKLQFFRLLEKYKEEKIPLKKIKNYLYKLALKYQVDYLLDSYYFN